MVPRGGCAGLPSRERRRPLDDGRTGFVVDDMDAFVAAIGRIDEIDRAACRRRAEDRFDVPRMVDDYERAYQAVVEGAAAPAGR